MCVSLWDKRRRKDPYWSIMTIIVITIKQRTFSVARFAVMPRILPGLDSVRAGQHFVFCTVALKITHYAKRNENIE